MSAQYVEKRSTIIDYKTEISFGFKKSHFGTFCARTKYLTKHITLLTQAKVLIIHSPLVFPEVTFSFQKVSIV